MKQSVIRELVKQALIETLAEENKTLDGAMTPEEEEMVDKYEKEQATKYALDNEEPLEEASTTPDERVDYLENILDMVWKRGRGNNLIDFKDLAQQLINNMFDEETTPEIPGFEGTKDALDSLYEKEGVDIMAQAREIVRKYKEEGDTVAEATRIVEAWKKGGALIESKEKPVSDYSKRREREKDHTSTKSDKPKKSHTSDSHEESDYMKRRKKEMYEANDPDREAIENWYHETNFYIDELSPEEIEKSIQDHYEEWTAVKDQYRSIEDYFAEVERNKDWY